MKDRALQPVGGVRVRFETHSIAPTGFPNFTYTASVLGHSSVQYTALFDSTDLDDAVRRIREQWPDSVIHAAETGVQEFRPNDTNMVGYTYGTAVRMVEEGSTSLWARIVGLLSHPSDGIPLRSDSRHNPLAIRNTN